MQRHRRRGSLRSSRRAGAWIAALLAAAACDGRIDSEAEPGTVTGESGTSAPGGDSSTPERDDAGPSGTPDAGHGSDAATDSGTDASGSSDANTGPADGGAPDVDTTSTLTDSTTSDRPDSRNAKRCR